MRGRPSGSEAKARSISVALGDVIVGQISGGMPGWSASQRAAFSATVAVRECLIQFSRTRDSLRCVPAESARICRTAGVTGRSVRKEPVEPGRANGHVGLRAYRRTGPYGHDRRPRPAFDGTRRDHRSPRRDSGRQSLTRRAPALNRNGRSTSKSTAALPMLHVSVRRRAISSVSAVRRAVNARSMMFCTSSAADRIWFPVMSPTRGL